MAESMVEQSPAQQTDAMPLLYNKDAAHKPFNPVQTRLEQLWATLFEEDSSVTYQQYLIKTWKLLKQAAYLLVFLVISVVAICVWIWGIGFRSGLQFRQWLEVEKPSSDDVFNAVLKVLIWPFEWAFEWANWYVKNYLGWEFQPDQPQSDSGEASTASPASETSETIVD